MNTNEKNGLEDYTGNEIFYKIFDYSVKYTIDGQIPCRFSPFCDKAKIGLCCNVSDALASAKCMQFKEWNKKLSPHDVMNIEQKTKEMSL